MPNISAAGSAARAVARACRGAPARTRATTTRWRRTRAEPRPRAGEPDTAAQPAADRTFRDRDRTSRAAPSAGARDRRPRAPRRRVRAPRRPRPTAPTTTAERQHGRRAARRGSASAPFGTHRGRHDAQPRVELDGLHQHQQGRRHASPRPSTEAVTGSNGATIPAGATADDRGDGAQAQRERERPDHDGLRGASRVAFGGKTYPRRRETSYAQVDARRATQLEEQRRQEGDRRRRRRRDHRPGARQEHEGHGDRRRRRCRRGYRAPPPRRPTTKAASTQGGRITVTADVAGAR